MVAWAVLAACAGRSEDCVEPLDAYCAHGDCPPSVDEIACEVSTLDTGGSRDVACDGFEARMCTVTNATSSLYLFDATGALAAVGTWTCPLPTDVGPHACDDQGGWVVHGPPTDAVLACVARAPEGYCYE
ncbi:MAG: hypothetical protein ABMA64_28925 [Myxococcota bacterium]